MPSLLDLTSQGDVGTIADESKLSSVTLMTPQQLYELWERQNWSSHTIDFEQDKRDWQSLDADLRSRLAWNLSGFFIGEERVTTQFSGLVMAYESQSEEAFLTTQQVDEARHTQHFNRFYEQVLGIEGTFEDRLAAARRQVSPAFVELFDGVLTEWGSRLVADPSDVEAKVDFVTLYHMIIEGTLALTGQWFLTDFMERKGILAGLGPRLPADLPGRAPPRRLRDVAAAREGARPGTARAHRRAPGRADPAGLGRARALASRRQPVRDPRLRDRGGQHLRLQRAQPAAEGDRDRPRRHRGRGLRGVRRRTGRGCGPLAARTRRAGAPAAAPARRGQRARSPR